jgi:hypothetical protein
MKGEPPDRIHAATWRPALIGDHAGDGQTKTRRRIERVRQMVESAPNAIVMVDREREIDLVNTAVDHPGLMQ